MGTWNKVNRNLQLLLLICSKIGLWKKGRGYGWERDYGGNGVRRSVGMVSSVENYITFFAEKTIITFIGKEDLWELVGTKEVFLADVNFRTLSKYRVRMWQIPPKGFHRVSSLDGIDMWCFADFVEDLFGYVCCTIAIFENVGTMAGDLHLLEA